MNYPTRIYYTESDKALMWARWQKGESLNSIGRHFGRSHSSIQNILSQTGGIRPAQRRRPRLALTLAEREEIFRGVVAGCSIRSIAVSLRRAPSTVSRELRRNGGRRRYRANKADEAAWARTYNPRLKSKSFGPFGPNQFEMAERVAIFSLPGKFEKVQKPFSILHLANLVR